MTRTGEWIGKAWKLVIEGGNFWKFVLLALIYLMPMIIYQIFAQIWAFTLIGKIDPLISSPEGWRIILSWYLRIFAYASLFSLFVLAPLMAMLLTGGLAIIINLLKTNRFEWGKFWIGAPAFGQAALVGFVIGLFSLVAQIFCFFPLLIVQTLYFFSQALIADRRLSFWQAMEASRQKTQANFWGFLGFYLAVAGIGMLGAVACGLGMFVTLPIFLTAIAVAYRDLWPEETAAPTLSDIPSS